VGEPLAGRQVVRSKGEGGRLDKVDDRERDRERQRESEKTTADSLQTSCKPGLISGQAVNGVQMGCGFEKCLVINIGIYFGWPNRHGFLIAGKMLSECSRLGYWGGARAVHGKIREGENGRLHYAGQAVMRRPSPCVSLPISLPRPKFIDAGFM